MAVTATYPLATGEIELPSEVTPDDGLPKEPTEILNHCEQAQALFIAQFQDKPRLDALICVFVDQVQELEVAIFDLITERAIDTAVGSQLDVLGDIVGQERQDFGDDDYRTLIRARIKANRSDGHPEQLIEILRLIADPAEGDPDILLTEHYPAAFTMQLLSDIGTLDPAIALALLRDAKPAGVDLTGFIYSTEPAAEQFTFDDDTTQTLDAALGFGDTIVPASGGKLTTVLG